MSCRILLKISLICICVFAFGISEAAQVGDAAIKHVIVHKAKGRFCGWPANYGTWSWGNEILVGFKYGYHEEKDRGHSVNRDKPIEVVMARSLDGGETWKLEHPDNVNSDDSGVQCPGGIDFTHTDFALRCRGEVFNVSYDLGRSWSKPYILGKFGQPKVMARTDYLVEGKNQCLIFLTAAKSNDKEGRVFCVRTVDGGRTLDVASWLGPEPEGFSIMPSTVRLSETELISAIRRKEKGVGFIDVYKSNDNGKYWEFLSMPCATGKRNGNPAEIVQLKDGRLVVTYGYRSKPHGMRAKISKDGGKTWGLEIHLRDDGRTWDIGYPQTVVRPDGKLVTLYYYTTEENPEQHIAGTIWDPDRVTP